MKYILSVIISVLVLGVAFVYGALLITESFDSPPQNAQIIGTGIFVDAVNKNLTGTVLKNNIHVVQRYALPFGMGFGTSDDVFFEGEIVIHDSEPDSDVNFGLFNSGVTSTNEKNRLTVAFRHLSFGRFFYIQMVTPEGGIAQNASWGMPDMPQWSIGERIQINAHYTRALQKFFVTFSPADRTPVTMTLGPIGGGWFIDSIGVANSDGAAGPGKSATFSIDAIRFSDMPFPPPDASPPIVSILSPHDGDVVSCTILIQADATDDVGVTNARFLIDSMFIGEKNTSPYEILWDTRMVSDGSHIITAEARDEAGHSTVSKPIMITVRNIIPVMIDIKPGSEENSIHLVSKGLLPVAILGEENVDVRQIDISSIRLANTPAALKKNGERAASFEDINDDSFLDLVLHFKISSLEIGDDDTNAFLNGRMIDGKSIEGSDAIRPL